MWWSAPWLALVPLLAALPRLSARRAALGGWLAGSLCSGLTLLWLLGLIPVGGSPAVLAYALLVPFLGAYWALNAVAAWWLLTRWRPAAYLGVPAVWACSDWVQNRLFTGFGWVQLGYTQGANLPLLQFAAYGGIYLVTALIVAVNVLLAGALMGGISWRTRALHVAAAAALVGVAHAWGAHRVQAPTASGPALRVGIVQGTFATEVKWDLRYAEVMWAQQVRQSQRAVEAGADVVIWSEAALGLEPFQRYAARLTTLSRDLGVPLLLGCNYVRFGEGDAAARYTNAVMLVHPDGRTDGPYEKRHLTPFGEYTPLKRFLPFLDNMIPVISDFSPGTAARGFDIGGVRALPLICFESVFGHEVRAAVAAVSPDLLVHVTNVGWFGRTVMPEQDLVVARVRAIETGLPMLRAANVGISAVVGPRGELLAVAASDYGRTFIRQTLVAQVPPERLPTLYARVGDAFVLVGFLCAVTAGGLCYTRASRST